MSEKTADYWAAIERDVDKATGIVDPPDETGEHVETHYLRIRDVTLTVLKDGTSYVRLIGDFDPFDIEMRLGIEQVRELMFMIEAHEEDSQ